MKKIFFLTLVAAIFLFESCTENGIFNEPPSSFIVETENLNFSTARINWTKSIDPEGDMVFYKVFLENKLIKDSIYYNREYTISDLKENTLYQGEVVANDSIGNQTMASFDLKTSTFPFPSDFQVTVTSKDPKYSSIQWTKSTDTINREILYNVFLNDSLYKEETSNLNFTFYDLKGLTEYKGKIVAINPDKNTLTKEFNFKTEKKVFDDDIHLENQEMVNQFAKKCYNVITGDLIIGNFYNYKNETDISDISKLSELIEVKGNRLIINNTNVTSINSLKNTITTNENLVLTIANNPFLKNLDGLENIKLPYSVIIESNDILENADGLKGLEKVYFELTLRLNPKLNSVKLNSLTNVYQFNIESNIHLENLNGLENLNEVTSLNVSNCTSLVNFNGFKNLTTVGDFLITRNNAIVNMKGFESLVTAKSINITNNTNLLSLDGLNSLTKFGDISISNNANLNSLNGIENVSFNDTYYTRHDIIIDSNPKLLNLNPLKDYKFRFGKVSIHFNTLLSDFCGLNKLFSVITLENGFAFATNNAFNPSKNDILNGKCSN